MGLATIDSHSQKVQTKLYKIPNFGVNRPKSKQDTAIWKFSNVKTYKEMYGHMPQEPITRSLQLPHIPVTAFSQTDLLLV